MTVKQLRGSCHDRMASPPLRLTDFEAGYFVGLLVGEGHFGGDGRQPQITLRMHVRHVRIFEWIVQRIPLGRLYGPYSHGGRDYYQWMARGAVLREQVVPLLDRHFTPELDEWAYLRFEKMKQDYGLTAGMDEVDGNRASASISSPEAGV